MFRRCEERLDATCLGVLQVDSQGNVNVSKRGDGPRNYVGPGGFIDFTTAADTIVFVSAWMHRGKLTVDGANLRIVQRGAPKFVDRVDETTFNGRRALRAGKRVFYATHVGLFRLTRRGMELTSVLPGIDVRRDILDVTPMKVVLPASGQVAVVPDAIVSGERVTMHLDRDEPPLRRSSARRQQATPGSDR